jgi:hypothetical protein
MKIYTIVDKKQTSLFADPKTNHILIPSYTRYTLKINKEAVKLLQSTGGSTAERTKYLILNLWNCNAYPLDDFDILSALRNADEIFGELIVSLFEMCSFVGDSCLKILDELAIMFKDEFQNRRNR